MAASFRQILRATPGSVPVTRQRFRRWLAELAWPDDAAAELVLAVSEAVSNGVEHAYPSPDDPTAIVTLTAQEILLPDRQRRLVVTVTDQGRWREPPACRENRRRGFPLMRAFTEAVDVHRGPAGTRVVLTSHQVPNLECPRLRPLAERTNLADVLRAALQPQAVG